MKTSHLILAAGALYLVTRRMPVGNVRLSDPVMAGMTVGPNQGAHLDGLDGIGSSLKKLAKKAKKAIKKLPAPVRGVLTGGASLAYDKSSAVRNAVKKYGTTAAVVAGAAVLTVATGGAALPAVVGAATAVGSKVASDAIRKREQEKADKAWSKELAKIENLDAEDALPLIPSLIVGQPDVVGEPPHTPKSSGAGIGVAAAIGLLLLSR